MQASSTQAEHIGTELEGQLRRAMTEVDLTHEPPAAEHDPAPGMLVIETDGGMVRYGDRHLDGALVEGGWDGGKVGVAGGWVDGHLRQPRYVAAREAAPAFARRLGTESSAPVGHWTSWPGTHGRARPVNCGRWSYWVMEPSGSGSTWPRCSAACGPRSSTGTTLASTFAR